MTDSCIISIDISHGRDSAVLCVGKKRMNQTMEIVNAFQGEEAIQIYEKLIPPEYRDVIGIDKKGTV